MHSIVCSAPTAPCRISASACLLSLLLPTKVARKDFRKPQRMHDFTATQAAGPIALASSHRRGLRITEATRLNAILSCPILSSRERKDPEWLGANSRASVSWRRDRETAKEQSEHALIWNGLDERNICLLQHCCYSASLPYCTALQADLAPTQAQAATARVGQRA